MTLTLTAAALALALAGALIVRLTHDRDELIDQRDEAIRKRALLAAENVELQDELTESGYAENDAD